MPKCFNCKEPATHKYTAMKDTSYLCTECKDTAEYWLRHLNLHITFEMIEIYGYE